MSTPKVRTTVTLDHDLVERFAQVASKERRSFSSTLNGWLQQVIEPAEYVAAQIDHDRAASAERLRSLMGAIEVVNDHASQAVQKARGVAPRSAQAGDAGGVAPNPPPCNTGGKLPEAPPPPRGVNSGFPLSPAKVQAYADSDGVPTKALTRRGAN